jgi:2-C-methyl-D-erythritol 4-phosphate cytidylyltransferase
VIPGGATRNDSTLAAIRYLTTDRGIDDCKVLFHDAVRPLVGRTILRDCVTTLDRYEAVDVVIETADTIVEVDNGVLSRIPQRSRLRRGQTPQAFRLATLRRAYQALSSDQLARFTDDCAVVLAGLPDVPIAAIEGSDENIKITRPIDIYLADRLLQSRRAALPTDPLDHVDLDGVVAVIGGTSGIGEALVDLLSARGARAVPLSRSAGGLDVRDEHGIANALGRLRDEKGPLAAVVNTAAVLTRGPLHELPAVAMRAELEVNLLGAMNVARTAYPLLRETRGHLLMFTSSSYTRGRAGYATYSATKAGIVNLTQALAEEWASDGVTVNSITPARPRTPMRSQAFGEEPADTLLPVERVAEAAVRILADDSTGHVFDVRLSEPQPA